MPEKLDDATRARARRALLRRDPVLARVIRREGACGLRPSGDPYRALLQSIVYQQLAGAAAGAIDRRVRAPYRGRYPRPDVLLAAPDAALREAGLSRQKIAAMRAVAAAFADGTLCNRRLHHMNDDEVLTAVTQVRGIGEWTAHMLLMFSLGRPDVLPVGDYGVRKSAMQLYGLEELPKRAELEALAEPWRPYRSVAAWYLWRVIDTQTPGSPW
ncbi:MAG TPA: DNA-3-methyladenine glycosylase 2 family protein [Myxococcota bacterium]